jgi:hypothetical protein
VRYVVHGPQLLPFDEMLIAALAFPIGLKVAMEPCAEALICQ